MSALILLLFTKGLICNCRFLSFPSLCFSLKVVACLLVLVYAVILFSKVEILSILIILFGMIFLAVTKIIGLLMSLRLL